MLTTSEFVSIAFEVTQKGKHHMFSTIEIAKIPFLVEYTIETDKDVTGLFDAIVLEDVQVVGIPHQTVDLDEVLGWGKGCTLGELITEKLWELEDKKSRSDGSSG